MTKPTDAACVRKRDERIKELEAYVDQLETQSTKLASLLVEAMGGNRPPVPKATLAEFLTYHAQPGSEFPDEVAGWLMLDSTDMLSRSEAKALIEKYELTEIQLDSYLEETQEK